MDFLGGILGFGFLDSSVLLLRREFIRLTNSISYYSVLPVLARGTGYSTTVIFFWQLPVLFSFMYGMNVPPFSNLKGGL